MPTILTERPQAPAAPCPPRKRWTRAECERLEGLGLFDQQRIELVQGELIDKMGKNRPHVGVAALLHAWLRSIFGDRRVNAEAPIDVAPQDNPTNQPEPDIIVVTGEYATTRFWTATPQPADLALVVEIADSSLQFDLTTKAELYARAGITEYWVFDLPGRRLIAHRQPQAGQYASVTSFGQDESASPLAAPEVSLRIAEIFP
jgi:Uma2 family endonuclease